VFLGRGLEDEIGQAFEHEVPNEGRKIDVDVLSVILKFLRVFDDPQVRIPMQNALEGFPPRRAIFLLFHSTV
jgi:hypothetical protein